MSDADHEGHVHFRTRHIWCEVLDDEDETPIAVSHLYLPESEAGVCPHCHEPHQNPGVVGLALGDEFAAMDAELALTLADRLVRAAHLVLEAEEQPADLEREIARFGAPPEPPRSSFKPGDVIAVPPDVIKVTGFRPSSRLVIKRCKMGRERSCKSCGRTIVPGDLYAAASDPLSDRCIRCVDGWPLATIKGVPE
jgi:hypothetical protein